MMTQKKEQKSKIKYDQIALFQSEKELKSSIKTQCLELLSNNNNNNESLCAKNKREWTKLREQNGHLALNFYACFWPLRFGIFLHFLDQGHMSLFSWVKFLAPFPFFSDGVSLYISLRFVICDGWH